MSKQQTAVEWLQQLYDSRPAYEEFILPEEFEQAQRMEEEQNKVTENTSDGYHTFKELYDYRKVYNAALFNEWAKDWYIRDKQIKEGRIVPSNVVFPKYHVHKSWKHNDGELCFGGGWFIVVAVLPTGQISNHYEAKDWDLFQIPETSRALYPFDGHTSKDVLERLKQL